MQPPGFLRHPLSLILCVSAACMWHAQTMAWPIGFIERLYMCCSDSFGSQDKVDIHRGLRLDIYYIWIPQSTESGDQHYHQIHYPDHVIWGGGGCEGGTHNNWVLSYSCKLTQSLSVNPGLHTKTFSLEDKESQRRPLCRTICGHQPPAVSAPPNSGEKRRIVNKCVAAGASIIIACLTPHFS